VKHLSKVLGIIAIIAVIWFSTAACDDGSTGGGDTWSKLTSGTGKWIKTGSVDKDILYFFEKDGKKKIDIDGWEPGMFSISGNTINIGGGSSDTATITITSDTTMTISDGKSGYMKNFEGTYTKK